MFIQQAPSLKPLVYLWISESGERVSRFQLSVSSSSIYTNHILLSPRCQNKIYAGTSCWAPGENETGSFFFCLLLRAECHTWEIESMHTYSIYIHIHYPQPSPHAPKSIQSHLCYARSYTAEQEPHGEFISSYPPASAPYLHKPQLVANSIAGKWSFQGDLSFFE